jgi:acetyl esterase/lipase
MDINRVHPELRKATASFPKLPVGSAFGRALTRFLLPVLPLLLPQPKLPTDVKIEWMQAASGRKLRVYTPAGSNTRAAMLYIHGGGMMIGSPAMDDALLASTALELDIVIVSPDYRLAPENPYPSAVDDCHSAWAWLLANAAQRNVDPKRIAIGGVSAGGGLAAGLVLRLQDEGGAQPAAQWLFCPMLDDRTAQNRSLDEINHFVWNNKMNLTGWSSYLGKNFGTDDVSHYAAPARRTDLSGLPNTWIGVGDVELFFEEDQAYANKLSAAGVACELDIVVGAPHAFDGLAPDSQLAKDYLARAKTWLKKALNND